ncbi:hypothetical protein KPH14_006298 [Odynerus spinipes]|uniref:Uncharacterized protein n=1 Tax=Odynerus spinipes TaxID=1348599 RepID=A0AAD9RCE2_9HYME|nr:hypothetical protein KPH14_006298 [Odynerus spinipes]
MEGSSPPLLCSLRAAAAALVILLVAVGASGALLPTEDLTGAAGAFFFWESPVFSSWPALGVTFFPWVVWGGVLVEIAPLTIVDVVGPPLDLIRGAKGAACPTKAGDVLVAGDFLGADVLVLVEVLVVVLVDIVVGGGVDTAGGLLTVAPVDFVAAVAALGRTGIAFIFNFVWVVGAVDLRVTPFPATRTVFGPRFTTLTIRGLAPSALDVEPPPQLLLLLLLLVLLLLLICGGSGGGGSSSGGCGGAPTDTAIAITIAICGKGAPQPCSSLPGGNGAKAFSGGQRPVDFLVLQVFDIVLVSPVPFEYASLAPVSESST